MTPKFARQISRVEFLESLKRRPDIDEIIALVKSHIAQKEVIRCTYCKRQIREDEYCHSKGEMIPRCGSGFCDKQMPTEEELAAPPIPYREAFPPEYGSSSSGGG